MKTRQGNNIIDRIGLLYIERELNYHKRSNAKTGQDNDVIDMTSAVFTEFRTKLLWSIKQVQSLMKTWQDMTWHDQSYRCDLYRI